MSRAKRGAVAVSATALMVMGSSVFLAPGASAATHTASCGGSVTAKPGDSIKASAKDKTFNLGTVTQSTEVLTKPLDGLLSKLLGIETCTVSVTIQKVTDTVDEGGKAVTDTVKKTTKGVTDTVKKTTKSVSDGADKARKDLEDAVGDKKPEDPGNGDDGGNDGGGKDDNKPDEPGKGGGDKGGSGDGGNDSGSSDENLASPTGNSNSAPFDASVPGFESSPASPSSFGKVPSGSSFSTAPYKELSFDSKPSSGLRYGSGFGDYAPEFGMLGQNKNGGLTTNGNNSNAFNNAGQAESLPFGDGSGIGLPVIAAVLALAGVSAGLVRTWVLQKAATVG